MRSCAKFAAACTLVVLGAIPHGAAMAADLVILTNQGATPGVRELAAAFSRASGHHVTVIQADDAILQQRVNDGTSVGGILGSGDCGACGGAGACATATVAIIMDNTVSAAQAIRLPGCFLRIWYSFSRSR